MTTLLPVQSDDPVSEDIEGKALARVPIEVGMEEVVSAYEEIPGVVDLESAKFRKLVFVVAGTEEIIGRSRCKNCSDTDSASDELLVFAGDGMEEGTGVIEGGHFVCGWKKRGSRRVWPQSILNIRGNPGFFISLIGCTSEQAQAPAARFHAVPTPVSLFAFWITGYYHLCSLL